MMISNFILCLIPFFLQAQHPCYCPSDAEAVKIERPFFYLTSETKQELVFCGFAEKLEADNTFRSEVFEIVDCQTKKTLFSFGNQEYRVFYFLISGINTEVFVTEFLRLPWGKGSDWIKIPFYKYGVNSQTLTQEKLSRTFLFGFPRLPKNELDKIIAEYEYFRSNRNAYSSQTENRRALPYKMLLGVLNGNARALSLLDNMAKELNADGELAVACEDALTLYEEYQNNTRQRKR